MKLTCSDNIGKSYCPIALGNGDLSLLVDYTGGTRPQKYGKVTTGIWRAGLRYDKPDTPLVPFGFFEHRVDGAGRIVRWNQTFHVTAAASESLCVYENGSSVHSYIYCHLLHNLVVIRKELYGAESLHMVFAFQPARTMLAPLSVTRTAYCIDTGSGVGGTLAFFSPDDISADRNGSEITLSAGKSAVFYLAFDEEAETYARFHSESELEESHRTAWTEYWAESTVPAANLPEKVLQAARTSEYHLRISSTAWSIPTGIYPTHWQGRYFAFDEFFALEGLLAAGHGSIARKIPDFRLTHLEAAKRRAYEYFGEKSAAARFVWEAIEIPGIEGAPCGFWLDHIFHMAHIGLGAWHCQQQIKEPEYLRNTAYPLLRACAEFFRLFAITEKDKGHFIIGKCTDLERLGAAQENAYMTTCGAIALFRAAVEAAEILDVDSGLRTDWTRLAAALTESLPQDEHSYLPYPGCADKSIALFSGLYPYNCLSSNDPKQRRAIEEFCATENRFGNMYPVGGSLCTWYAGWKALTFHRLGKQEAAEDIVRQMANETGGFSEVYEVGEIGTNPWFTTAEGILLQAVCEIFGTYRPENVEEKVNKTRQCE